jgi:Leucine-rich repeat (LRR) protein
VIPPWINNFKDLITLDLSRTEIIHLPEEVFSLKSLQIFKITAKNKELSKNIGNLTSLRELFIQMPNVSSLPNEIFNLFCLQTL